MSLQIGNETATTGLSKRIWDVLKQAGYPGEQMTEEETANYNKRAEGLQKTCYAIAKGIVEEIQANAALKNTVGTGVDSAGDAHVAGATQITTIGGVD